MKKRKTFFGLLAKALSRAIFSQDLNQEIRMFATEENEIQTQKDFQENLQKQLLQQDHPLFIATRTERDAENNAFVVPVSLVSAPEHDITHVFNNQAMKALSHAIDDIAAASETGQFIATFENFDNFLPYQQYYSQLAFKLDSLRIWGEGTPPPHCPHIDFIPTFNHKIKRYWTVLFTSEKVHAVLIGRQINDTDDFEQRYFLGFYSFNPFLVDSIRRKFNLISSGLDTFIQKWEQEFFPPISMDSLNTFLSSNNIALPPSF